VILTSSESKRLTERAVAAMEAVKNAFNLVQSVKGEPPLKPVAHLHRRISKIAREKQKILEKFSGFENLEWQFL
jgi:hypothetical protein